MESTTEPCPSCGEPLHPDDLYCGGCGRPVDGAAFPDLKSLATDDSAGEPDEGATVAVPVTGDDPAPPEDEEPAGDAVESAAETATDDQGDVEPLVVNEAT